MITLFVVVGCAVSMVGWLLILFGGWLVNSAMRGISVFQMIPMRCGWKRKKRIRLHEDIDGMPVIDGSAGSLYNFLEGLTARIVCRRWEIDAVVG